MRGLLRGPVLPMLILLCLTGCGTGAPPAASGGFGMVFWPDRRVVRDVATIRLGMEQARADADATAARQAP